MSKIGVLALQGAFIEHIKILRRLGVDAIEVRLPQELEGLQGLIIPGGESTTIGKLAVTFGLMEPIMEFATSGRPVDVWHTDHMGRVSHGIAQEIAGRGLFGLCIAQYPEIFVGQDDEVFNISVSVESDMDHRSLFE